MLALPPARKWDLILKHRARDLKSPTGSSRLVFSSEGELMSPTEDVGSHLSPGVLSPTGPTPVAASSSSSLDVSTSFTRLLGGLGLKKSSARFAVSSSPQYYIEKLQDKWVA
jgi:hypothetical protein